MLDSPRAPPLFLAFSRLFFMLSRVVVNVVAAERGDLPSGNLIVSAISSSVLQSFHSGPVPSSASSSSSKAFFLCL